VTKFLIEKGPLAFAERNVYPKYLGYRPDFSGISETYAVITKLVAIAGQNELEGK